MKVGIAVFAHTASGMEVGTIDTALGLKRLGVETVLFADRDAGLPARAAGLGHRVVRLARMPRPLRNPRVADALFLPTKLALARRLAAALREHPVDVLHAFSPGAAAHVPNGIRVAVQAWFHPPTLGARFATYLPVAPRFPPIFAANVAREIQSHASDFRGYRRADLVLCNTAAAADAMRAAGFPAAAIPPAIDMPASPPSRPKRTGPLRVAFCGHPLDRPRKGLRELLDALALTRTAVRLTLVGAPSDAIDPHLARARRAGHVIDLMGHVPRTQYLALLEGPIDVLAFPSRYEEWGYALFEGLSRGVPAIAFDGHPYGEIIDRSLGRLVPAGDVAALAAALEKMAAGEIPSRTEVWTATRDRFGADAVARRLVAAYASMLSRKGEDMSQGDGKAGGHTPAWHGSPSGVS